MIKIIRNFIIIVGAILIFIFIGAKLIFSLEPKYIKAYKIIDTVQNNYDYLEFRDKKIERPSREGYLMDDIIPKIGNYLLIKSEENLSGKEEEILLLRYKDGSEVVLRGNKYLSVGENNYKIVKGNINLDIFYSFMD